jgi:hypothetical protein
VYGAAAAAPCSQNELLVALFCIVKLLLLLLLLLLKPILQLQQMHQPSRYRLQARYRGQNQHQQLSDL